MLGALPLPPPARRPSAVVAPNHQPLLCMPQALAIMPQELEQQVAAKAAAPVTEPATAAGSGGGAAGEPQVAALPEMVLFRCKEAYGAVTGCCEGCIYFVCIRATAAQCRQLVLLALLVQPALQPPL